MKSFEKDTFIEYAWLLANYLIDGEIGPLPSRDPRVQGFSNLNQLYTFLIGRTNWKIIPEKTRLRKRTQRFRF